VGVELKGGELKVGQQRGTGLQGRCVGYPCSDGLPACLLAEFCLHASHTFQLLAKRWLII
jgi:hypothetical protein